MRIPAANTASSVPANTVNVPERFLEEENSNRKLDGLEPLAKDDEAGLQEAFVASLNLQQLRKQANAIETLMELLDLRLEHGDLIHEVPKLADGSPMSYAEERDRLIQITQQLSDLYGFNQDVRAGWEEQEAQLRADFPQHEWTH